MKISYLLLLPVFALLVTAFNGCKKEGPLDPTDFATGISQLRSSNQPQIYTFTFSADEGGTFIAYKTSVAFKPNAFKDADGNVVTGNVQLSFGEIYTKGQMLLSNIIPICTTGWLETSGEAYVNVTQNGVPLAIINGKAIIYFKANSTTVPRELFNDSISSVDSSIIWQLQPSAYSNFAFYNCPECSCSNPPIMVVSPTTNTCDSLFVFPFKNLGWINCDYFTNFLYPNKTPVDVRVPTGYQPDKVLTYIVFKNLDMVVRGTWSTATGTFLFSGNYQLPVGEPVKIVGLTIVNGLWQSCFMDTTITANAVYTLQFSPTTLSQFEQASNSL